MSLWTDGEVDDAAPYHRPLTYPGTPAPGHGVLTGEWFLRAEPAEMPAVLKALRVRPMARRCPVLAVGSNACPAQLRRKFEGAGRAQQVIPLTMVEVHGIDVGVSAHVSRPGYVPATPILRPGHVSHLFVLWLDDEQVRIMDATEPNYDRTALAHPDVLLEDRFATRPSLYVSRHGRLVDQMGRDRRLRPQPELIPSLLEESERLRAIAGPDTASWLQAMADPAARDEARRIWVEENLVNTTSFQCRR